VKNLGAGPLWPLHSLAVSSPRPCRRLWPSVAAVCGWPWDSNPSSWHGASGSLTFCNIRWQLRDLGLGGPGLCSVRRAPGGSLERQTSGPPWALGKGAPGTPESLSAEWLNTHSSKGCCSSQKWLLVRIIVRASSGLGSGLGRGGTWMKTSRCAGPAKTALDLHVLWG